MTKLMKADEIQAVLHRRFRVCTTDSQLQLPVVNNVLAQAFSTAKSHEVWLTDITYLSTSQAVIYLATILDMHSRMIVGWSMDTSMESRLVVDALVMALGRSKPAKALVLHSDRDSQYASEHYQAILRKHEITCSMSRVGNCYDNSPLESFWASLKKELVYPEPFATIKEAKEKVFQYIEVFCN